jgi:hypothetical protein
MSFQHLMAVTVVPVPARSLPESCCLTAYVMRAATVRTRLAVHANVLKANAYCSEFSNLAARTGPPLSDSLTIVRPQVIRLVVKTLCCHVIR